MSWVKSSMVNNSVSEEMVSNKQSRHHFEQLELMAPSDGCTVESEGSRWIHVVITIQYTVEGLQI